MRCWRAGGVLWSFQLSGIFTFLLFRFRFHASYNLVLVQGRGLHCLKCTHGRLVRRLSTISEEVLTLVLCKAFRCLSLNEEESVCHLPFWSLCRHLCWIVLKYVWQYLIYLYESCLTKFIRMFDHVFSEHFCYSWVCPYLCRLYFILFYLMIISVKEINLNHE